MKNYEVVVVGGGIGGLTTGALLAHRGVSVCLLERQSRVGGCLANFDHLGFEFEPTYGLYRGFGPGEVFDRVFSEQLKNLGSPGDLLVAISGSGNSPNMIRAVEAAKTQRLLTVSFLGKDGGKLRGKSDIEVLIPSPTTARIQECHKFLYHTLCEWIESKVD